jgi:hypothetical protein
MEEDVPDIEKSEKSDENEIEKSNEEAEWNPR